MIGSFRDNWLLAFYAHNRRDKRVPSDLETRLFRKLQMIDDAVTEMDLRIPPSNHFEKSIGNLSGWHSIRVNQQWRLIFVWNADSGEADGIYLDDHSYH